MRNRKPELLAPAGSLEVLKTAFLYGADAVYIGGEAFGLRAMAKNFSDGEMAEGIRYAHERGKKVYVTANIIAHNAELREAEQYFKSMRAMQPDALIVSDPALFMLAKEHCPDTDIHISTQANNTNYGTFRFWHSLGARRVVTARELSLDEIREIRANIPEDLEIETFVHGAMCISYSGRCLLSSFLAGRDANRGACTHPCRWKYAVVEEKRPGEYMPVEETDKGTFIFNSKDLCMIGHIPELLSSGIDSFKIEGRMKTELYAAAAVRTYRNAIDDCLADPALYREKLPVYLEEIGKCTHREFTTGFFFGKPDSSAQIYHSSTYIRDYTYLGTVESVDEQGRAVFHQKNKFSAGDVIEIMKPDGRNLSAAVTDIENGDGVRMPSAPHPKELLKVSLSPAPEAGEVLRVLTEKANAGGTPDTPIGA